MQPKSSAGFVFESFNHSGSQLTTDFGSQKRIQKAWDLELDSWDSETISFLPALQNKDDLYKKIVQGPLYSSNGFSSLFNFQVCF